MSVNQLCVWFALGAQLSSIHADAFQKLAFFMTF